MSDRSAAPPADPTPNPRPWPGDDPDLVPLLPMVYVAWADGALSTREIGEVRKHLAESDGLPEESWAVLERWLQPEHPPTPVELAGLRDRIRALASELPDDERHSLASLGAAMARHGQPDDSRWERTDSFRTLEAVEEILGVLGREATRALLSAEASEGPAPAPPIAESSFPVERMQDHLAGSHRKIRDEVLALILRPEFRVPEQASTAERRAHVLERLKDLAESGLGTVAMPRAYGGRGDIPGSMVLFETLAMGDLSLLVKYGVQFGLFGGSILQLGTGRHHERWLERVGSLDVPGCYAMTEIGHGSNVREVETRVRYLPDEDAFEVHTPHVGARKDWIGNAALHGIMATVFAQLEVGGEEHGVHAFLVPIRGEDGEPLPGISIEDCGEKIGLHGVDNGRLGFDRVRIPRENLLNRFGTVTPDGRYESSINSPGRRFFTMLGTLVTGRISIAAASVSAAKSALTIAVHYSSQRRQFGPSGELEVPVLDYLTQQRLLLPRVAASYALHFAVRALIDEYGTVDQADEEHRSRIEVEAAALKVLASRHAVESIQASREACGGRGYLAANRFGELRDDTDVFTTFEGANVVLLQLVARGLLSRYREEMGDLSLRGMVRVIAERAGTEVQRRNPVRSRRSSEDHLRDPETHLDAMTFREQQLLQSVARRLKTRIDDGMDSFDAVNECQDHLVSLARAHAERRVLEEFNRAVENAPDTIRETLTTQAELWALWRLEEDRAWFLESGYMEGSQTRAIRSLVNQICREVRPDAVHLVDGFGIPDELLRAPAAFGTEEAAVQDSP